MLSLKTNWKSQRKFKTTVELITFKMLKPLVGILSKEPIIVKKLLYLKKLIISMIK